MHRYRGSGLIALVSTTAAFIGLALGMFVPGATALAAPSTHLHIDVADVGCAHLIAGDAQAYFSPMYHSVLGPDADLQLWLEPDDIIVDPPTIVSGAAELTIGAGDSGLSGTFELVNLDDGRVVGRGSLDAHYTPADDVHVGNSPKSTGNERYRDQLLTQPMSVTGTLTLDLTAFGRQIVMSLDECFGTTVDIETFTNDPASSVTSYQTTLLSCVIVTEDAVVQLAASDEFGLVLVDGVLQTSTASYPISASEGVTLTMSSFGVSAPLEASSGGGHGIDGAPSGLLTATADLAKQPKLTWTGEIEGATVRIVQQNLAVSGSIVIAFDDGTSFTLPMNDESCEAFDFIARTMTRP